MTFAQGVILNQSTVYNEYMAFSHDVTATILVFQNNDTRLCWCSKQILWETLFLSKRFLLFQKNLQRCWPRDWKHSIQIHVGSPQTSLLNNQFPASLFLPSSEALGTRLAFGKANWQCKGKLISSIPILPSLLSSRTCHNKATLAGLHCGQASCMSVRHLCSVITHFSSHQTFNTSYACLSCLRLR